MNDSVARSEFSMHLREMRQRSGLIALCALVAAVVVFGLRVGGTDQSTATAVLQVTLASDAIDDGDVTEFRARRLAELSTTSAVLELAAEASGLTTTEELREQIDVELGDTPGFLSIRASSETAQMAVSLANGMADAIVSSSSVPAVDEIEADRVAIVEPARLDQVRSTSRLRTGMRDGLLAFVVTAIVAGEAVVLFRIMSGRFSPTDAALEASALADAPVLDLRSAKHDSAMTFFHEHLERRPIITVFDLDPTIDVSAAEALASAAAELNPRVLLVDGGGNGARLHAALELDLEPGVADLVRHGLELRTVVRPSGPRLRCGVITAGVHQTSDPPRAVMLADIRDQLAASGAHNVVVSIAAEASFDESAAAVHALPDCVILAFDPNRHRVREIRHRLEQLRTLGASVAGLVLTSASHDATST